jgi:putative endonuclease
LRHNGRLPQAIPLLFFTGIAFAMTATLFIFNTNFLLMARVDNIGLAFQNYYVYIMTNKGNTVLYTGVTSELEKRCIQHRTKNYPDSFTAKYNINKLVYYERFGNINDAITREKQIKAGSRKKKIDLIEKENSNWLDLFDTKVGTD